MKKDDKALIAVILVTIGLTSLVWWFNLPECEIPVPGEYPSIEDHSYLTIGEAVSVDTGIKYNIILNTFKGKDIYRLIAKNSRNNSIDLLEGTKIQKNKTVIGLVLTRTMPGNLVYLKKQFMITKLY